MVTGVFGMAKSARASSEKANKSRLKAKLFGPIEDARAARLSARLQELANAPRLEPAEPRSKQKKDGDVDMVDGEHLGEYALDGQQFCPGKC